ncbi:MAG: hypothetical protein IKA65_02725 [Lentisphaeria bacterium]|nr:hypothetical protein [Lentisphaeria bacterium]
MIMAGVFPLGWLTTLILLPKALESCSAASLPANFAGSEAFAGTTNSNLILPSLTISTTGACPMEIFRGIFGSGKKDISLPCTANEQRNAATANILHVWEDVNLNIKTSFFAGKHPHAPRGFSFYLKIPGQHFVYYVKNLIFR